eukprot:scaffold34018_cov75-Phaeocystis_antarctica.AAC.2
MWYEWYSRVVIGDAECGCGRVVQPNRCTVSKRLAVCVLRSVGDSPVADRRRQREGPTRVARDVAVGHALSGLEVGEQGEPRWIDSGDEPGPGAGDEVEHGAHVAVAHVLHHLSA